MKSFFLYIVHPYVRQFSQSNDKCYCFTLWTVLDGVKRGKLNKVFWHGLQNAEDPGKGSQLHFPCPSIPWLEWGEFIYFILWLVFIYDNNLALGEFLKGHLFLVTVFCLILSDHGKNTKSVSLHAMHYCLDFSIVRWLTLVISLYTATQLQSLVNIEDFALRVN